jgi:hypothetical protein
MALDYNLNGRFRSVIEERRPNSASRLHCRHRRGESIDIFDAETTHPEEMQRVGSQATHGNLHLRREAKHAY